MFEKSTKGQVLYVRHGETVYNRTLSVSLNCQEVQTDEKLVDSSLCEEGVKQAECLAEKFKELIVKNVFCSPLNRCLETAFLSLKSHPLKEKITVIIHPYITEVVHGAQDLAKNIPGKKEIYNQESEIKFDWTYFDSYYTEKSEAECFFINYIDNVDSDDDVVNTIIKNFKEQENKDGLYSQLLTHFINRNKRPESLSHLFMRTKLFKKFLKDFLEKNIDDHAKTLVITHSAFIRMSTTEIANEMDKLDCYPEDCYRPLNCEVISIKLV